MSNDNLFEAVTHRVIHPCGATLQRFSPKAYQVVRWEIAQWKFMKPIFREPMSQHLLLPFAVRKGDAVVDIGANTGQFTLPLARLVGPSGSVHSFEPISQTFRELEGNVLAESLQSTVKLNRLALGETESEVSITVPLERLTEATLAPHDSQSWQDYQSEPWKYTTESCLMTTLDDYVKANHIERISFIKCDVEGAELSVLKGARGILGSARPPVIMLEIFEGWTKTFGYEPRDIIRFLEKEAGYEVYWIHAAGLKRVRSGDKIIPGIFWQWVDFICVVPDVHSKRINLRRFLR